MKIVSRTIKITVARPPRTRRERGFTLLFAILVSSMLLAIALSIASISSREIILSSFGRESQFAFYAADSGTECALYWDFIANAFSTSTPAAAFTCNSTIINPVLQLESPQPDRGQFGTSTFSFNLDNTRGASGPCVTISLGKAYSGATPTTHIESRGHNTCVASSPTLVERGLEVGY